MSHGAQSSSSNGGQNQTSPLQIMQDFIMGGTAGVISKTVCAPLERVKLLLQTQHTNPKLAANPYKGILNCFTRVVKEEGTVSLWRGNMANVYRYFPTQALNFAIKDYINRVFNFGDPKKAPGLFFLGRLMSGGIAGSISLFGVYPLDFARTRLGADLGKGEADRQFKGLGDCMKKIVKTDGIIGLYRGFSISVVGIFIYRSLYFGGYDAGLKLLFQDKKPSFWQKFAFAQFVTSASETIAYPSDTIRRRLMMESGKPQAERVYKGSIHCYSTILKKEGMKGFFKGNLSNCWRSVGSSMVLVLYDELQELLKKKSAH